MSAEQPQSPTSAASPPRSPSSPSSADAKAAAARLHRPILQTMPESRTQSFDEIYGPPENFLEIEVSFFVPSIVVSST